MQTPNKKAFTLVELIVVITILAILATIAFVSLQGYSASSRDSVRITDASNIKTSLELFVLSTGKYPTPDAYKEVTYSGSVIWEEGTFGEDVLRKVRKFNRSPKDPLQDVYYTYSRLNTQKEYEIGVALERDQVAFSSTQTQAAGEKLAISYITGTYNGLVAQVSTGATTYILAVPTIISTDPTVTDIQTLVTDKKLSYTGYQNIPSGYEGTSLKTQGEPDLVLTNKLVAYSGTTLPGTTGQIGQFIGNLQTAYTGTTLSSEPAYATILGTSTTNYSATNTLGADILNSKLGGEVVTSNLVLPSNCSSVTGYTFNTHTYNIPAITHNNGTTVTSVGVTENNGTFTYDLTATCNDGVVSYGTEGSAVNVSCDSSHTWNGSICEVKPANQLVSTSGLISYYPLDGDFLDNSGPYNLTGNGTTFVTDGHLGQAVRFNGSSSAGGNTVAMYLDGYEGTFSVWMRRPSIPTTGSEYFFTKSRCGGGGYQLYLNNIDNSMTFGYVPNHLGGSWSIHTETNVTWVANEWTHLVFSHGPGGMRMYRNGTLLGSNSIITYAGAYSAANIFYLGKNDIDSSCPARYFTGDLDEFAIWSRQLSDVEVATLAQQ